MLHVKPKKSKSGIKMNIHLSEHGINYIGLEATTLIGVISFIITGLLLHKFRK